MMTGTHPDPEILAATRIAPSADRVERPGLGRR
jgi:hypothetical protein